MWHPAKGYIGRERDGEGGTTFGSPPLRPRGARRKQTRSSCSPSVSWTPPFPEETPCMTRREPQRKNSSPRPARFLKAEESVLYYSIIRKSSPLISFLLSQRRWRSRASQRISFLINPICLICPIGHISHIGPIRLIHPIKSARTSDVLKWQYGKERTNPPILMFLRT